MLGFGSYTKQSLTKSQGELAKCSQSNNINRNLLVKKIIMAKKVTSKAVASKASAALRSIIVTKLAKLMIHYNSC